MKGVLGWSPAKLDRDGLALHAVTVDLANLEKKDEMYFKGLSKPCSNQCLYVARRRSVQIIFVLLLLGAPTAEEAWQGESGQFGQLQAKKAQTTGALLLLLILRSVVVFNVEGVIVNASARSRCRELGATNLVRT